MTHRSFEDAVDKTNRKMDRYTRAGLGALVAAAAAAWWAITR